MPSLKKMLQSYDLDLVSRICAFWGVDCENLDLDSAVDLLHSAMSDLSISQELIESLPADVVVALQFIIQNGGKTPWSVYSQKFGEIRELGPAKRERESPEQNPISTSEKLWYRGLIGKAFMNLPPEPREYAFIPDDLLGLFPSKQPNQAAQLLIRPSRKHEVEVIETASSRLLDHITDWLCSIRKEEPLPKSCWDAWNVNEIFATMCVRIFGLIQSDGQIDPTSIKDFMSSQRNQTLQNWSIKCKDCREINELRMLPGLVFEGTWENDPVQPRQFLLELLTALEPSAWYSLGSLISFVKKDHPDFMRPAGDYDSWFIRKQDSEGYLRGIEYWDDIEGAWIRFMVTGPLHWLGLVNLARSKDETYVSAFSLTARFRSLMLNEPLPKTKPGEVKIKMNDDLVFSIPCGAPLLLRYQLGRFCDLQNAAQNETQYRITASSFQRSQKQGLRPTQLVQLLEKYKISPLPKSLTVTASNWERFGLECSMKKQIVLEVKRAEVLCEIKQNPRLARLIVKELPPDSLIIQENSVEAFRKALLELGVLPAVELDV